MSTGGPITTASLFRIYQCRNRMWMDIGY